MAEGSQKQHCHPQCFPCTEQLQTLQNASSLLLLQHSKQSSFAGKQESILFRRASSQPGKLQAVLDNRLRKKRECQVRWVGISTGCSSK